jgi:valyl-tRNA synthetase
MQPQMEKRIEKATRRDFPDGIPAFGTDALRYTFCALASTGRDVRFDLNRITGYRNFCNKLWNAANYVRMNLEADGAELDGETEPSLADRWIVSRFQKLLDEVHFAYETFRFDVMAQRLYEFVWNEYCDWYLELTKPVLRDGTAAQQRAARRTLLEILEAILRVAHPVIPYLTETVWREVAPLLGRTGPSVMLETFPRADASAVDEAAEVELEWVKGVIMGVRNIRGEMNLSPGKAIDVILAEGDEEDRSRLERNRGFLVQLARLASLEFLGPDDTAPPAAIQLVGAMKVLVPMSGLIDKDAELGRLDKEIERRRQDVARVEKKLANDSFTAKAPAQVVDKERSKRDEALDALTTLEAQRAEIAAL